MNDWFSYICDNLPPAMLYNFMISLNILLSHSISAMTTIKDIAKMAGVSHGTVSNVLNGRGNVSVKKIKLVEEAAQKLGYQLNVQAKILKEGVANSVSIILPNIIIEQFSHLYNKLFFSLNELGYETTIYLTYDSAELELQFIQKIATKRDSAIIVVSCLENANAYYQNLSIAPEKIIFVYNRPKFAEKFVSLDYKNAGETIAKTIMDKHFINIGLLLDHKKYTYTQTFKKGLLNTFKHADYDINLNIEFTSNSIGYSKAYNFFSNHDVKYDAIITTGIEKADYIINASYFGSQQSCPPIYTLGNTSCMYRDNIHQYQMHYSLLSQCIIDLIEGKKTKLPINTNYRQLFDTHSDISVEKQAINVLMLSSPITETVKKLLPHCYKMTGITVNLITKSIDEIHEILHNLADHPEIDVSWVDVACFPWFARSKFKPLTELKLNLDQSLSQYSTYIIERFSYFNNVPYALPFDPSIQMLFYRKDIFNDSLVKRYYFERYHQPLVVPTDFREFNQLTEFFNQYFNPDSPIKFGSCITLGKPELLASEFLLRYYANGGRLVQGTTIELDKMIASITLHEFEQFLYVAENLDSDWWGESVKQFEDGNIAMLIVYMNLFSCVLNPEILHLTGYAAVPGDKPLLGGGSLCMSKYSDKDNAVSAFFDWLFSPVINEQMAWLNGSTMTDSISMGQQLMNNYPWLKLNKANYFSGVRENVMDKEFYLDLPRIEKIIGHHLLLWTKQQYSSDQTIDNLNLELLLKTKQLLN